MIHRLTPAATWLRYLPFLALSLLATAGVTPALAQEYRGRVQGTVTDTSQAAIVGATVTLQNVGTGVGRATQTNDAGHFLFDLV
ncbi:MAG TPA: carboxypeptidase-like regulatory domain-containing protein, partial [Bryobacteraceae bacterium]|nr:carboxypeptidase-like regulatory domain-containing protein [Bryobacteraceae bacterium]